MARCCAGYGEFDGSHYTRQGLLIYLVVFVAHIGM